MSNNKQLNELLSFIKTQEKIDDKINSYVMLGILLKYNNLGCYSLSGVESELVSLLYSTYRAHKKKLVPNLSSKIAFVVTEAYETGGHTRLMERLSSFLSEKPPLITTKKISDNLTSRLLKFFSSINYISMAGDNLIDTILTSAECFSQYDKLILNIHPEDIKSVLAIGIAKKINTKLKVYFVNHADHVFTYGTSISDIWFEISLFGKKIDEQRNLFGRSCFLGIPLEFPDVIKNTEAIKDGDSFLMSGSAFKFKPTKKHSLVPVVNYILKNYPNSKVLIIGVRPAIDYWWWPTKMKNPYRLILKTKLPFDKYLEVTSNASIFIDSHPLPGGTAFPEQYLQGKNCIGITSPIQGYSPVELFKADTIEESIAKTESCDIDVLQKNVFKVHSFSEVKKRFCNAIELDCLSDSFFEEILPWNGDAGFLEKKSIVRIPPQFSMGAPFTRKVIKITNIRVTAKFLVEWLAVRFKNTFGGSRS